MARYLRLFGGIVLTVLASIYLTLQVLLTANSEPGSLIAYPPPYSIRGQFCNSLRNQTIHPPLQTDGRYIVDSTGARVKLVSINWYGASDELFVVGGLNIRHRDDIARTIKSLGFNSVRLPYSDQLVIQDPVIQPQFLSANPDLIGRSALEVYSAIVISLTSTGLLVIPNNHITTARWCCDASLCDGTWRNDYLWPFCRIQQTQENWIQHLDTIMRPHIHNPLVIGADLRNEVRGVKDRFLWHDWAAAAEAASEYLHILQPNWLMFIEGVSSANDVSGARSDPIVLKTPHKVVYSAHVYGWSGWGSLQPYWRRNYASFAADMDAHWGWLLHENISPVWIGEFGAPATLPSGGPQKGDLRYWRNLMRYLKESDADWGYWALNPRKPAASQQHQQGEGEVEGYGILEDDWETVRWDYRLWDLGPLMVPVKDPDDARDL